MNPCPNKKSIIYKSLRRAEDKISISVMLKMLVCLVSGAHGAIEMDPSLLEARQVVPPYFNVDQAWSVATASRATFPFSRIAPLFGVTLLLLNNFSSMLAGEAGARPVHSSHSETHVFLRRECSHRDYLIAA